MGRGVAMAATDVGRQRQGFLHSIGACVEALRELEREARLLAAQSHQATQLGDGCVLVAGAAVETDQQATRAGSARVERDRTFEVGSRHDAVAQLIEHATEELLGRCVALRFGQRRPARDQRRQLLASTLDVDDALERLASSSVARRQDGERAIEDGKRFLVVMRRFLELREVEQDRRASPGIMRVSRTAFEQRRGFVVDAEAR